LTPVVETKLFSVSRDAFLALKPLKIVSWGGSCNRLAKFATRQNLVGKNSPPWLKSYF